MEESKMHSSNKQIMKTKDILIEMLTKIHHDSTKHNFSYFVLSEIINIFCATR